LKFEILNLKSSLLRFSFAFLRIQIQLMMKQLGLIGYPLGHSFSKKFFAQKFDNQGISHEWQYDLYPIDSIEKLPEILRGPKNQFLGMNVTIPYKTAVLPFLDALDADAAAIGAVNCIKIKWEKDNDKPHLTGYNTDVFGFEKSLLRLLGGRVPEGLKGLILGTGGAAKAVDFVLKKHKIPFQYVSRTGGGAVLSYDNLDEQILSTHHLVVNTTPLGMSPNIEACPSLPYEYIDNQHFILDLLYNPETTRLMALAQNRGAKVQNGMEMLIEQAEQSWRIWNEIEDPSV
jgi:shikimate dehydrogenase